jgi:hypothetical protein
MVVGGTLCVKINNMSGKYFGTHKGVIQGDHLSPLLFNIIGVSLARMSRKAQENNLIRGLVPHLIQDGVVILQYADDTIILFQDDMICHQC